MAVEPPARKDGTARRVERDPKVMEALDKHVPEFVRSLAAARERLAELRAEPVRVGGGDDGPF